VNRGWNNEEAPVYVQSLRFQTWYIRSKSTVKTIQLLSCYDVALNLIFTIPEGEFTSDGMPVIGV
jgi:glycerophosphoryl diester phosphodiesterase